MENYYLFNLLKKKKTKNKSFNEIVTYENCTITKNR
jgi:hypothetical protein